VSNIIYENKIWPHEQDFGILPKRGALPAELHHEGGGGRGLVHREVPLTIWRRWGGFGLLRHSYGRYKPPAPQVVELAMVLESLTLPVRRNLLPECWGDATPTQEHLFSRSRHTPQSG
jgi:hypothetical protein